MIEFYKYQGAGNDFILIDNRQGLFRGDKIAFVKKWCERRFGIGSDGLIFLENSDKADFLIDFYNPDGSQSFCGNGSRCIVAFAHDLGIVKELTTFEAIDGLHDGEYLGNGQVKIAMHQYGTIQSVKTDFFIDTGSPHYIAYEADENRDILEFGKAIRYSDQYKEEGVNVNLVTIQGEGEIDVRTYERGVEAETFACGTGATACGLSYANEYLKEEEGIVKVNVKGGNLRIHYKKIAPGKFEDIWLEGPGVFVFKGNCDV